MEMDFIVVKFYGNFYLRFYTRHVKNSIKQALPGYDKNNK